MTALTLMLAAMTCLVHAGHAPLAPPWLKADIGPLSEGLDLDETQRETLSFLLEDQEIIWLQTQQALRRSINAQAAGVDLRAVEDLWRAAAQHAREAARHRHEVERRALDGDVDMAALMEARRLAEQASEEARRARANLSVTRWQADPGGRALQQATALAHRDLEQRTNERILVLLDGHQRTQWDAVRRAVLRGRRLRLLALTNGGAVNLLAEARNAEGPLPESCELILSRWAQDTDLRLEALHRALFEARTATTDQEAAAALGRVDELCGRQVDDTLEAAHVLGETMPSLAPLKRSILSRCYPATWGPDPLDSLLTEARRAQAEDVIAVVLQARQQLDDQLAGRSATWMGVERQAQLMQRARHRGMHVPEGQRNQWKLIAQEMRDMGEARRSLVQGQLGHLQRLVGPKRLAKVAPDLSISPEDSPTSGPSGVPVNER
ncbi:MAG: hypothetical protein MK101_02495 [Phycisphaerales bacterium]|nr:hypothetical protein [Phycisphaerales bacterium]